MCMPLIMTEAVDKYTRRLEIIVELVSLFVHSLCTYIVLSIHPTRPMAE